MSFKRVNKTQEWKHWTQKSLIFQETIELRRELKLQNLYFSLSIEHLQQLKWENSYITDYQYIFYKQLFDNNGLTNYM